MPPGLAFDVANPDKFQSGGNPSRTLLGAWPAFLDLLPEGFCAVTDGAAERFQFGGAGRFKERMADGFEKYGAVEIAIEGAEVEEFGVAVVVRKAGDSHGRMVAGARGEGQRSGCLVADDIPLQVEGASGYDWRLMQQLLRSRVAVSFPRREHAGAGRGTIGLDDTT